MSRLSTLRGKKVAGFVEPKAGRGHLESVPVFGLGFMVTLGYSGWFCSYEILLCSTAGETTRRSLAVRLSPNQYKPADGLCVTTSPINT